jgi:signal transduction histidine kinase
MEREVRKLKTAGERAGGSAGSARGKPRSQTLDEESQVADSARRLDQYLGVARGEIDRLDYIVRQFLQAIRPTPPQIKLSSLNEVVSKTLELLQPELDNRGLHVRTRLARELPASPLDASQIQQVLVNLIKNAMQAMTRGGTLTLQTGEGPDGVWVSVADTGGGIPEDQLNRIFEPFYTTKKKGSGLGLMLVQRIVRAHGGRIDLQSQVGRGTTFRIWLPLHERKPRLLEAPMHD